jgi:hypothetical protein
VNSLAVFRDIPGSDLKRVSQIDVYQLGSVRLLETLREGEAKRAYFNVLSRVMINLEAFFLSKDNAKYMPNACTRADEMFKWLDRWSKQDRPISQYNIGLFRGFLHDFEQSLEEEFARLPTYVTEQIGIYSTEELISKASNVFPVSAKGVIPERAYDDFRMAGACLAFDLPTACGFHAFRAADTMIRAYYQHFVGTTVKAKPRDWGGFIRVLREVLRNPSAVRKPNERTIELLDSIRASDRNPVIHPEVDLSAETALATFDMCKTAIVFMANDIMASP